MTMTYASAGVNVSAGDKFAQMIGERIKSAWPEQTGFGGFGGTIELPGPVHRVGASMDGAGTKSMLADVADAYECVGQDAAVMSLMDLYADRDNPCLPVAILDAIILAKLVIEKHIRVIDGIITACKLCNCHLTNARLAGGETAEMPGMYAHETFFDVITAAIGIPRRPDAMPSAGDVLYGWPSGGVASNGLSLVRPVFKLNPQTPLRCKKLLDIHYEELEGRSLGEALMVPTPIWIADIEQARANGTEFSGHAHITGGGLIGNVPRMLPPHLKARIFRSAIKRPRIFDLIQSAGGISQDEMDSTFNQGVMVVSAVKKGSKFHHPSVPCIGELLERHGDEPQVELVEDWLE